jgi:hypothetical protein
MHVTATHSATIPAPTFHGPTADRETHFFPRVVEPIIEAR